MGCTLQYYKSYETMAKAFGVSKGAVQKWAESDSFPKKVPSGYPMDGVTAWVEAKNARVLEREEKSGDKDEKIRLECERLRVVINREKETLKQAELETKRQSKKLVERIDIEREAARIGQTIRGRIDAMRQHETAKHPQLKDAVDAFCTDLMEEIRAGIMGEGSEAAT